MEAKADNNRKQTTDRQSSSAFAMRLKQLRVLRGFRTARAFAQALGIDENRYTRWERGEVEPSVAMLAKMAEILNIPVDILVSGGDVAAGLPSPFAVAGTGGRTSAVPSRLEPAGGFREEAARFDTERSPEELSQKVLHASRAHLMSLLERRVAGMSQAEIDSLIAKLTGASSDARLSSLETELAAGKKGD